MQDMQRNGSNPNNGVPQPHAACASCKHQRKKCGEDCILHPYFPAEKSREFQAVHKVFGVSNLIKFIRSVPVEDRQRLAASLIWEASCRQKDPVLGPFGEYTKVSDELKLYKTQLINQNHQLVTVASQQNQNHQLMTTTNQLLMPPPTPPQQGMMYKPTIAWNGTKGINGAYNHENGTVMVDPSFYSGSYNYSSNNNSNNNVQGCLKINKQEKENMVNSCSTVVTQQPSQHQHSVNTAYNQQYYLPGHQYGSVNGKKMDSTLWEAGQ